VTQRQVVLSNLEVKPIHGTVTQAAKMESPSQLVCAGTTCLAITYDDHDTPKLWVRRGSQRGFSQVSPLDGRDQDIEDLACADAESCLVVAGQGPSAVNSRIFVTTNAGRSWTASVIEAGMRPASVGCLPNGPCWVAGEVNNQPVAFVSQETMFASWSHLVLPSEPAKANNQITCATVSTCVDVVGIPYAMNSAEEILSGGLRQGLEGVLQPTQVGLDDKAGCDASACYVLNGYTPDGTKVVVSQVRSSGVVRTVQMATHPGTFDNDLTCSLTNCVIETDRNDTDAKFYTVGSHLSLLSTPRGLYFDRPVLECVRTSPTCLLALGETGSVASYPTTLHNGRFDVGPALLFSVGSSASSLAQTVPLASCVKGSCYEVRESAGQLVLLTLAPGKDEVQRAVPIRTNAVGITPLQPVVMACPAADLCQVIGEEGNGPYQLLSLNPQTDHVATRLLPGINTPESLACATKTICVLAVAGISQHHSFPALWTDNGGLSWRPARALNALNDLSTDSVTCGTHDSCLAIGQHDFVDGYGTLRPFVARSVNGGATWRLVKLSGPVPYSLLGPGYGSIACAADANCVGVLETASSSLILGGSARSGAWSIRTVELHYVSKNSLPNAASIACGTTRCLATLTINPEENSGNSTPSYSIQSLIINSGFKTGHVIVGKLLASGMLAASASSHSYLETNPYGALWITTVANAPA